MGSQGALRRRVIAKRGFTIVELLIVIVVIGVLAGIVIVSYGGVRERAINTSRSVELAAWRDAFVMYKASRGSWPPSMVVDDEYCLGTGYPVGAGGVPRCHNYQSSGSSGSPDYAVLQSDNATLMAELKLDADLPKRGDRTPMNGIVGPYVRLKSDSGGTYVRLTMTQYGVVCPSGTESYWVDTPGNRTTCIIEMR